MISIIVAASKNDVIGKNGGLPWSLPEDLRRFRQLTTGHAIIMGRKTFESIGRPLPNRRNIIITRQENLNLPDVEVVNSLDAALKLAAEDAEIFIIGGGEIFQQAMSCADRIYLTRINVEISGDSFFPVIEPNIWKLVASEAGKVDAANNLPHEFLIYERIL